MASVSSTPSLKPHIKLKISLKINTPMKDIPFSKLSKTLTSQLSKSDKKADGIFFTPPNDINNILSLLEPYMNDITSILEPSCGSCEFINRIGATYGNKEITGIEYNKFIYDSIKYMESDDIKLLHEDFLELKMDNKYDLIIGNPPFKVMKKKDVSVQFHDYFDGRPNIFILFIIKSLKLLTPNGILSFILPQNFLNCLYYDKTRRYIHDNFNILNIIECNSNYIDTQQDTIILMVQNSPPINNHNYTLNVSEYTIFGTKANITTLNSFYTNYTTLDKLHFNVNVGNVVWNQCKSILTSDSYHTRLIYSSDISDIDSVKIYKNLEKKNYIDKTGESGPLLVLNRGYGVGQYKFEYCLLDLNYDYLIENHLICIRYLGEVPDEELIQKYSSIIKSFSNKKTQEFIKIYFGNNAINTTEINYILPIFIS